MKKLLFFAAAVTVMFSSCSKDTAEVTTAPANGKVVMSASMTVGETTRTVLNESGDYEWTAGDMAGVVSAGVDKPVMLHTKDGGTTAEFIDPANQIDYVGTKNLLFFYPYVANVNKTEADNKVTSIDMTIPTHQIYRDGSFSTMTAPAIAAVETFDAEAGAKNTITFKPVASYVKVPVRGIGTLESIKMQIYKNGTAYNLSGTGTVDVEQRALTNVDLTTDHVTIDFGKGAKGLTLYDETVNLMFVIPAHLNVVDALFEFEATLAEGTSSVSFNGPASTASPAVIEAYSEVAPNAIIKGKEIILGADNYYVVESERDFVTWAHQTYLGQEEKPAYIISDLDFATYAASGADAEKVTSCTADEWNAVQWYRTNDYAIYTIGVNSDVQQPLSVAYEIDSDVDGKGKAATISDLKVIGTSIFGANGTVKNVVLKDIELNATNNTSVDFFAATIDSTAPAVVVKDVTIDGGAIIGSEATAANSFVTSWVYATLHNAEAYDYPTVTNYPTVGTTEIQYAPAFDLDVNANISEYVVDGAVKFNSISTTQTTGVILSVDADEVENVGVLLDKCNVTDANPFSVVIDETSYWTGYSYTVNDDDLYTAEELAYAVANRVNVELRGLDIDLMGTSTYSNGEYAQNWEAICNQDINIDNIEVDGYYKTEDIYGNAIVAADADSRKRVISNINIETVLTGTPAVAVEHDSNNNYSLFGQSANLNEVTVKDLTITLVKNTKLARVAGLAYTGTANDVAIDGLKIRTEIENIGQNAIGAIISSLPSMQSNTAKNCVVTNANILSFKNDGETSNSALSRGLFGYLAVDQSQTHTFENCSIGVNSPAKQLIGKAEVKVPASTSSQDNPTLIFNSCTANAMVKKLAWSAEKGNYPVKVVKDGVTTYVNIGDTTIK